MKSKAIVFHKPFNVSIEEIDVPDPQKGQILTKTLYTGVSTGTETRVLSGKQGNSVFPLVPGYENIGEIIKIGEGVKLKKGAKVFLFNDFTGPYSKCWGGQVEYALGEANNIVEIPDKADLVSALYLKTGAIALHGVLRAKITKGDRVAIVGQGLIGHLAAQIAKIKGATVVAIDTIEERLAEAKKAGVDFIINGKTENVEKRIKQLLGEEGVNVAVDVTGIASTIDKTVRLLNVKPWQPPYPPSGRLLILGSYPEPVTFSYHPSLFDIEPDIYTSRDATPDDMREALKLILARKIKPEFIPVKIVPYTEAEKAYNDLLNRKIMRAIYRWS